MNPPPKKIEKKRIVVLGAAGRLGGSLVNFLEKDHSVIALTRENLNLGNLPSISAALEPLDYDFLLLCGALTGVDYCETHEEEAYAVNAEAPRRIAEISAAKGAHVTYFSTDMVFNGSKGTPYLESDTTGPVSVYGASKLKGEEYILRASPANLVVRVSWLYGPGKPAFPEWIVDKACAEKNLTLPGNKICCPTYSVDLVECIIALLFPQDGGAASGVFHLCNSEPCTWRDWGQFCVDTARDAGLPVIAAEIEGVPVDSVAAFVAKRPAYSAMGTGKFTRFTGISPRPWKAAIREFLPQSDCFRKHHQLLTE